MLLIRGGRVIDPVREVDEIMDVMIEGSQIVETGKALKVPADTEVIDATGLVVAPGLMDAHVHFRDPGLTYKEDIETGAAAAARGGFTTVVCMANTKPVVDNLETLSYVQEKRGADTDPCAAGGGYHKRTSGQRTGGYGGTGRCGSSWLYR